MRNGSPSAEVWQIKSAAGRQLCDNGRVEKPFKEDRTARKPIEEMTAEELRALVSEMRQRTQSLNEEMRVLQEQISENQSRMHRKPIVD